MSHAIPKSLHYFIGSWASSLFAAFFHVIFGVAFYEIHNTEMAAFYLAEHSLLERIFHQFAYQMVFVIIYAVFIFIIFSVVGYPLFLLLRNTQWIKFWPTIIVGTAAGVFIPVYFDIPIFLGSDFPNYFWLCGANGAVSAAVGWWVIRRIITSGSI